MTGEIRQHLESTLGLSAASREKRRLKKELFRQGRALRIMATLTPRLGIADKPFLYMTFP
jgi:hypothetical protein